MIRKKISRKKFSIIELSIYTLVLPISIGIMSTLLIYMNNLSISINYNTKIYSELQKTIITINDDFNNAYELNLLTDSFVVKNSKGNITYMLDKEKNKLLRNNMPIATINNFNITDIKTSSDLYPIYEISLTSTTKNLNSSNEFNINTKVSMPIRE